MNTTHTGVVGTLVKAAKAYGRSLERFAAEGYQHPQDPRRTLLLV